jgi:amino acid adenylation domain-containing protein
MAPAERPAGGSRGRMTRERDQIATWNRTRTDYPRHSSLGDLFAEVVARTPDAPAMTYGAQRLTYRELDRVTNSLAIRLRELGGGPGTLVALRIDRDPCVVVGMLATVKAGAGYLPLDLAHPSSRLRAMVADAGPCALLVRSIAEDPGGLELPVIAVSEYLNCSVQENADYDARVDSGVGPEDLAYVMYTSGSSGAPKGTCITHRNVVRLVRDTDYVSFEPGDRVAQISNPGFDAATFEVWGALLNGAELVGFDRDTVLSGSRLAAALAGSGITTMVMATPLFNQLAADDPGIFATVSQLLVGGDVMAVRPAQAVAALPGCTLLNGYGPTESTTFATVYRVASMPEHQPRVPIGRPIANTTCYVLDEHLRPQPIGAAGQLYIGGDGLCRGYLGRPDLTAERFVPDPFAAEPDARMYATGDRVRWLPDGCLDFLGREDFQVKVRGFRVELTEIDASLLEHPRIVEAVTVVLGDQAEDKSLISYYATAGGVALGTDEVMALLRERLPDYMIPATVIQLPELPKNANSKIDRASLPGPVDTGPPVPAADQLPAGNLLVEQITAILAELLRVPAMAVDENFFDSGGHSLLATRLLNRLRDRFQVDMALGDLFDDPTARGIAAYVRDHGNDAPAAVPAGVAAADRTPSGSVPGARP